MSGANIPSDSTHLSDQARTEMIEQYGGVVDSQYAKSSMMREWIMPRSVIGTDTLIDRRVGRTSLTTVTPGVRPAAAKTEFGRTSVTVDTLVLARDNRSKLNEFQTDFNARVELGQDHGKELGKFFDQAMLIAAMKGADAAAPTGLNAAFGAGKNVDLVGANDHLDPDLFYAGITDVITEMRDEDMDTDECVIFVRHTGHRVLLNNDKLISRDFSSDNGDFASGTFKTIDGVPVVATNRIPSSAIAGHELSNADNSNFYDVSATEAKAEAVIMHPSALMVGETIPLTSNVHYSDIELQWFIDSMHAFGANYKRPDGCGVVRKA